MMDDISKKNEEFLSDELRILKNIEELELCRESVFSLVEQHANGVTTNMPEINRELDKATYYNNMINDTASSINMYATSITYTSEDVEKYAHSAKKNARISAITLPGTIPMGDMVDDFTVDITNMGHAGVSEKDKLYVTMYSIDTLVYTEVILPVGKNISKIGERQTITVSGLPCPDTHNQYSVDFVLITPEDIPYSKNTIYGINVSGQITTFGGDSCDF